MPTYDLITLTTDYGLSDGFSAVLHGVIARASPWVRVVDITHQVPPGAVVQGAAVLAQSVGYFPPAVHVGVVDPGVGTARRAIAIETPGGLLVGPDNGLLPGAADELGGVRRAVHLTDPSWFLPRPSTTFHGRDIFAPVAARLAAGDPLSDAGEPLDPESLVRLPEPVFTWGEGFLEAEVRSIDRFGNVQLTAPAEALAGLSDRLLVSGVRALRRGTFGEAPPGRLIVYVDSFERVALAVNGGRAVVVLAVTPGDVVRISDDPGPGRSG
jgi:S-adenosylmethionine hydrolase